MKNLVSLMVMLIVMAGWAGDSAPFLLDTTSSLNTVTISYDSAWVGGDLSAEVVILDDGMEIKRTSGVGEFSWSPMTPGKHTLTYMTYINGVAQDEVYMATVFKDWKYTVADGKAVIVETTQTSGNVTIPSEINGYTVVGINDNLFNNCRDLTCITILDGTKRIDGLKNIGDGCSELKSVIVPATFFEDVDIEESGIDVPSYVSVAQTEDRWGTINYQGDYWSIDGPQLCLWSAPSKYNIYVSYSNDGGVGNNKSYSWDCGKVLLWVPEEADGVEFSIDTGIYQHYATSSMKLLDIGGYYSVGTFIPGLYSQITNIVLTGAAGNIPQYAFDGCKSLESIEIPDGSVIKAWQSEGWRFGTNGVLRSAKIQDNQTSEMSLKLFGSGKLMFNWKASSEFYEDYSQGIHEVYDYAYLIVDGGPHGSLVEYKLDGIAIGGNTGWQAVELDIVGEGLHTVRWVYVKDEMDDPAAIGKDCIWVDDISFRPMTTVNFDIGDATGISPASVNAIYESKINMPEYSGFNKTKYSLVGWSDGDNIYEPNGAFQMKATNVTLKAVYEANTIATPIIESSSVVEGGVLEAAFAMINITCDAEATIHYTLDGSTPTAASAKYTGAFEALGLGEVAIKAIALRDNYFDSPVATFTYTRKPCTLAECLNVDGGLNVVSDAPAWFRVTGEVAHDGNEALRSGAIGANESSVVELMVNREGTVSFWWKVSSHDPRGRKYDHVAFFVDETEVAWISGEKDWENISYTITGSGTHTLKWTYKKNGDSYIAGEDCAWLDEVVWMGGARFDIAYENLKGATHQNPSSYYEGMNIKFTAPSAVDGYAFTGWTPPGITTSDTGNKVVTANWEWMPQDAVVDAFVTGAKPITIKADWVKTELEQKFGEGKEEAFIAKFGDDFAAALTKKTGKRDVEGNELLVWHDYVAGTDPTDIDSTFKAMIEMQDGKPVISWDPNLNYEGEERVYMVYGKENLSDIWHSPIAVLDHFFKVDVFMPYDVTVTLNAGAGASVDPISIRVGQPVGELPMPTREGYTFTGWFTAAEGGDAVTAETVVTADMTIYAHWTIKSYTVAFNANGGVGDKSVTYNHGSPLGELPTPTREGYTFVGWFTAVEGGDAVTSETVVTSDMTIYAQWTIKSYTVAFNANGGVGDKTVTYNHGSTLGELSTPTREGYTFAGWFTAAYGYDAVTSETIVTSDMTIYAHWKKKYYRVAFETNSEVMSSLYAHGSTLGELTTPTREGYTFVGWFTAVEGGDAVTSETVVTSDMTIYAQWTIKSYTVVFDPNGGSGDNVTKSYIHGATLGELPTPTRDGYKFLGWFTASEGGSAVTSETIVTADMMIYARWEPFDGHDKVQLWEGGPYWATTNIGAENPEDYGYYFWWGDTVGYKRENGKWVASDGSNSNFCFEEDTAPTCGKDISTLQSEGWITAEGVLAPEHDAAKKHWGGDWRMPTKQEFDDLNSRCDWTWTTLNGVNGYVVRGRGDYASNSIFLPITGYGTSHLYMGSNGAYWSSVPDSDSNYSWDSRFGSMLHYTYSSYRYFGQSVRPVQVQYVSVKFDVGGGSSVNPISVRVGQAVGELPTPTRDGYTFAGWWTDQEGGVAVMPETVVTTDITIYARWKEFNPLYCVIDLTAGVNAASYPVTYLSDVPAGAWTDEYKTTKLVLRRIEPGSFKMGGSYDVTITKAFYCGVFEVTQKQYELVTGNKPSNFSGDTLPVEEVSWNMIRGNSSTHNWPTVKTVDSNSFVGRLQARTGLNFDLPTEAQWEYACRAGTTTTYYWGDSMDDAYAWYSGNSSSKTHIVGTRTPNAWGLYDMSGNVWEWCLDWYDVISNLNGPDSGIYRILRGGGFCHDDYICNSNFRDVKSEPNGSHWCGGFRLVGNLSE